MAVSEELFGIKGARITEQYLAQQVEGFKKAAWWKDHKLRISKFDTTYGGNLLGLQPEENTLANEPYVENSLKNSTHDIKRLAREAKGYPVFTKEGEKETAAVRAKLRAAAVDTIWQEGGGQRVEGLFYHDLIRGGFCSAAVYTNADSDYPQFMRLDPAYAYPTFANGKLVDMFYIETMKERAAGDRFGLKVSPKSTKDVDVLMFFDKDVTLQAIVQTTDAGGSAVTVTSRWDHKLGVVPVGFRALETADGQFRGLLDQLAGPLRARNRAMRLMIDYLEDMVNAPFEERGIMGGADALPGKTTVYHHDQDAEGETFMRRVAPAAPAAAVFGLLNYLDAQEQTEGYQPASRVGQVRQSQASGTFVDSTQGSLSSVVIELQGYEGDLRHDLNVIAMKIDEKFLNREKPLIRAVGERLTYTPKKDFKGWYYHKVSFGAAAGMDRGQADQRVLQLMGAGIIDDTIARDNVDFIENDTNVAEDVQRMLLRKVEFQKLVQDPSVRFSDLVAIDVALGEGKGWYEALKDTLPQLLAREQAQAAAGATPEGTGVPPGPTPAPQGAGEEALALQKGATPGANTTDLTKLAPPPFLQEVLGGR